MKLLISLIFYSSIFQCIGQTGLNLSNFPSGGSIGTAASTYETNAFLKIPQTTADQTLTIPDPTDPTAGKNITISNTGSVSFTIVPGGLVPPQAGVIYRWTGSNWIISGTGVTSYSMSQNLTMTTPSSGSGVPSFRSLVADDLPTIPYTKLSGTPVLIATGSVIPYAGTSAPTGYLLCDGSAVSRTTYSDLFAITGTTYGVGDGSTTFNLPDLRQKFPLGKAVSGTGSTLGGTGGMIDMVVTVDPPNTTTGAPSATVAATILAGGAASTTHTHDVNIAQFNSGSVNPPFISLNYIIKI